jgi:hypothetical protein
VKAISRIAECKPDALNTVDFGLKHPFSVGDCALWARLAGPQLAAQVAAVVSLVEAPALHYNDATVAKEVMAIKYMNPTSHSMFPLVALRREIPRAHFTGCQGGGGRRGSDSCRIHSRGRLRGGQASGC